MQLVSPEHDPNARLIRFPNPTYEGGWPAAESSKLFILGAVQAVGAALHGDDWTGKELTVAGWPESPIVTLRRSRQPKPRGIAIDRTPPLPKTTAKLKAEDEAAEKRHVAWIENGRALERLMKAVNWLSQRCRDGDLKPYARPAGGGEVMPMRASEWNIDNPLEQFVKKGGCRRVFHIGGYASPPMDSYIFFDRAELQEVLAREPDAPQIVGQADLTRLSPYLRLAVHIALARGYFDGAACDTQDAREEEVRAAWPNFIADIEPVDSTIKQIAKLMAFPDRKAIELGKRGGRTRKSG